MPSFVETDYPGCIKIIRGSFLRRKISETASGVISSSLSTNTNKQYNTVFKKWWKFCTNNKIDLYIPTTESIIEFLNEQYKTGATYSTLNTARSAINLILISKIDNNIVNRFLKGVFRLRPTFPRYTVTWDPNKVLKHLTRYFPLNELLLQELTLKLASLIALCTGQRIQTLAKITLNNIFKLDKGVEILICDMLKTSAPAKSQPKLMLPFFESKPELCVASTLLYYIKKTTSHRGDILNLFITHKQPYKAASVQTISRWIKTVLKKSGIDVINFKAYSTRHASTSAAHRAGTSIDTIRATAGWSKESEIFFKYYNRPIKDQFEFAKNILGGSSQ